jgi:hypothetical protein
MRKVICNTLLTAALATLGSLSSLYGQAPTAATVAQPATVAELGVMYITERTQYIYGSSLWMQGMAGEIALPPVHHVSFVADVTGDHASGKNGGSSISTVAFTMGPRYVWSVPSRFTPSIHSSRVFTEGMIGVVHGFDTPFPTASGTVPSWNTYVMQVGGGYDVDWKQHLTLRIIDAHYVRMQFPNGTANVQSNFRIGAGVILRLPPAWLPALLHSVHRAK